MYIFYIESLYWEEISKVWDERKQLLQERDQLSEINQGLTSSIALGEDEVASYKQEIQSNEKYMIATKNKIKKERSEKLHNAEALDRQEAERSKVQKQVNRLEKEITEASRLIVCFDYYTQNTQEKKNESLVTLISHIQDKYKDSNLTLRELVIKQASIHPDTRKALDEFIDSKVLHLSI